MQERYRGFYRRTMAFRRFLLRCADEMPLGDYSSQLYRDAADECSVILEHIKADRRPIPETPNIDAINAIEAFDAEVELDRFKAGQRAFGCEQ